MLASHATSQAAHLLRVQSEVSAIRPPLQGIESVLVGVQERFDNLGNGLDARLQKLETLVAATAQLLADNQIVARGAQEVGADSKASQRLPSRLTTRCRSHPRLPPAVSLQGQRLLRRYAMQLTFGRTLRASHRPRCVPASRPRTTRRRHRSWGRASSVRALLARLSDVRTASGASSSSRLKRLLNSMFPDAQWLQCHGRTEPERFV
jgi:hypothetical protein